MGAKLSKKKKGYCLGAGKDGESTETTEVEQKDTETQLGQKDAAEPNGEAEPNGGKKPTDQTLNNGASEEQKVPVEKNCTEAQSGKTTKDDTNKDQKSEGKPNAEQKKVEEPKPEQDKPENAKGSSTSQQMAPQSGKEKSQPVEKPQTDHNKVNESAAKEPTLEAKAVTTHESSEPKKQNQSVTEPSAPPPEHNKELAKSVPDTETKVEVEKMEKEQTPVPTKDQVSEQETKEQKPVLDSVKGAEMPPEIVESLVSETVLVDPVLQEPVAEVVEPEPVLKAIEPEPTGPALPETVTAVELVEPEAVTEPVMSQTSEEPVALVPVIKIVEPMANPELVPCSEPEKLSETRQETESLPEPLPSNEVPDPTIKVEENVENQETLDLVTESIETQAFTTECVPAEPPSVEKVPHQDVTVANKDLFEQAVEEIHEGKIQDMITTQLEVGDEKIQHDVKEEEEKESVSDKEPTEQGSQEKNKDCKVPEEVVLDTSKEDKDHEGTIVHDGTPDKNTEANAENHKMPAEELSKEPSAPLIVEKHGVSNGLPLKEEVKMHLENGCDKDLHELNGQGEGHEIAVCNE